MTFDQVERAIQFCLEQQAAFSAENAEFREWVRESFKQFEARQKEYEARQKVLDASHIKLREELEILKDLSGNLLTVAQMHSRRLDRLDGIGAS